MTENHKRMLEEIDRLRDQRVFLLAEVERLQAAVVAFSVECLSCGAPAVVDGFCVECAGANMLALTEDERQLSRDLIAQFFPDEDGVPMYAPADILWMKLHRAGFAITRRRDTSDEP